MRLFIFAVLALVVAGTAGRLTSPPGVTAATRFYVDQDATGANNGTSWDDAFTDLQDALAAAVSGDEVWVANGVYKPSVPAGRAATFAIPDGVDVYGGFLGFEGAVAQRNLDFDSLKTILSGEIGSALVRVDNAYHVVTTTAADAGSTPVLDGVLVTRGHANGAGLTEEIGGGIHAVRVRLQNAIVHDNFAASNGGGVYASVLAASDSWFDDNTGEAGGAAFVASSAALNRVAFSNNTATLSGGGLHIAGASVSSVTNATFSGDTASYGAAIATASSATVNATGVTVTNADATSQVTADGAVYAGSSSNLAVRNAIIWGNPGGQVGVNAGAELRIEFAILQGACPAPVACGSVQDANPQLGTFGLHGGIVPSIPIPTTSPALELGSNLFCAEDDARKGDRPFDGDGDGDADCDAGAYEYIGPPVLTITNTEGEFTEGDGKIFFTVHFSHKNPEGVKFDVVAAGGTATPGKDYNYSGPRTVDVSTDYGFIAHDLTLADDALDEPLETAVFEIQDPERAVLGDSVQFTAKIADNDAAPTVAFDLPKSNGLEKLKKPKITVELSAVSGLDVLVDIATGGSAAAGTDYKTGALPLKIPAGKLSADVPLTILDDGTPEGSETIILDLHDPTNAGLAAPTRHVYRIKNDDKATRCFGLKTTIYGTLGKDTIKGTPGMDVIDGRGGADTIAGLGGNDVICGRGGNDVLRGGPGNDRIDGGAGADTLRGAGGDDRLLGTNGNDTLLGQAGRDHLSGGQGTKDRCDGGPGTDTLAAAHGCETATGVP